MPLADLRICIACSAGGHMTEVRRLSPVYQGADHFYVTFSSPVCSSDGVSRLYQIPNVHRSKPLSWVRATLHSLRILLRERPDVVITTGAGVVVFLCVLAKLLGARLVFLETVANVDRPSLTGRLLYPVADLFIVPWERLLSVFPAARYLGPLF